MRLAISSRTGSLSTPMTSDAPISFAPAVAHSPIGPWAKTTTESPIFTPPDSGPLNPVEAMSARRTTCSSVTPSGMQRQVRLGRRDEQVLGLGAVDGVAEAPAAERLEALAVAALAEVARQAGAALAARGDRADEDALADLVAGDAGAELLDDADGLVADDQPGRTGYSPLRMWMSVPQIVVVVTRITASPTPA